MPLDTGAMKKPKERLVKIVVEESGADRRDEQTRTFGTGAELVSSAGIGCERLNGAGMNGNLA